MEAIGQGQCRALIERLGKRIAENEVQGQGGSAFAELAKARADAYRTALSDVLEAEKGKLAL